MVFDKNKIKKDAKEMFNVLENNYLDKLALLKIQQEYINRQNTLLSNNDNKFSDNNDSLNKITDELQKNNRNIKYSLEHSEIQTITLKILKSIFLMFAIVLIVLLVIEYNKR